MPTAKPIDGAGDADDQGLQPRRPEHLAAARRPAPAAAPTPGTAGPRAIENVLAVLKVATSRAMAANAVQEAGEEAEEVRLDVVRFSSAISVAGAHLDAVGRTRGEPRPASRARRRPGRPARRR